MDRTRSYTLEQASELSGLSADAVWHVCDRMGCSPDAVPAEVVLKLKWLVWSLLDAMTARAGREVAHG